MDMWRILTGTTLLLFLAGCSSVRVSQDYDAKAEFSGLRTFAWQYDTQPPSGDIRLDNSLTNSRIRSAVEQALLSAGYAKTERAAADFLVAYQHGIQQKIKSDNFQTGVGFGFGGRGRYGGIGIGTGTDVRTYNECILIIDVLEPGSGRLLWRGKGTSTVYEHVDPQKRIEKINEMVSKILGQFPPAANR